MTVWTKGQTVLGAQQILYTDNVNPSLLGPKFCFWGGREQPSYPSYRARSETVRLLCCSAASQGATPWQQANMLAVTLPGTQRALARQLRSQKSLSRAGAVGCGRCAEAVYVARKLTSTKSGAAGGAAPHRRDGGWPTGGTVRRISVRPRQFRWVRLVAVVVVLSRLRLKKRCISCGTRLALNSRAMDASSYYSCS